MSNYESQDSTEIVSHTQATGLNESMQIQFMFGQKIVEVNRPEELPLIFGRDNETCNIAISEEVVSRQHCVVDMIQGRIVLKDQSTNGSFLKIGQAEEICLRKGQFYPLNGRGMIKLGKSFDKDDKAIIYFKCR